MQVARLALMLFDGLVPLHHLGAHDRFLLSCAAELHDIGGTGSGRGHARRGAGIVFSHENLPFDLEERAILAFIIQSHRGKVQAAPGPWLGLVPPDSHPRALALAAILRIADGFDDMQTGSVHELRCAISEGEVACSVSGAGSMTAEKEHALARTDLFRQVFDTDLVIR
jgi:exopolyphosphatase/guanosine-5'-triphosphate,3'-diphosphate pyrophosphatase